jgi:DNA-binding HxlR family transcriptional regulator
MTSTEKQNQYEYAPQFNGAVEVLSDKYACQIISALTDGAMTATDIADEYNMSRQTVYRRLDQLESVGFVTSQTEHGPDGTQRRYFRIVVNKVHFKIHKNGIDKQVSVTEITTD